MGFMVGLMIGRLTTPEPIELQQVEVLPGALVVWFSAEPKLHGELVDGTLGLLLTVVAARALNGDWAGAPQEGRWRLQVNLREE